MEVRVKLLALVGAFACLGFPAAIAADSDLQLAGHVRSAEEGAMEGVVVSARHDGSPITVSVVSDAAGHFQFPSTKLIAGSYEISIRAVGYDLDGSASVAVATGKPVDAEIRLKKTGQLWAQLTNAEWMLSIPGPAAEKRFLERNCNLCHTYQRIVKSVHTAEEWPEVIRRMSGYFPGSTPLNPQRLTGEASREGLLRGVDVKKIGEFLASINLSSRDGWSYPLKTLPRVTGRATKVVVTEYDLPRATAEPHDVIVDRDGMVWYNDFGAAIVGKMDPKTGKVTEYRLPMIRKGFPVGTLDLQFDPQGDVWVTMMMQAAIAKIERATGKVTAYPLPASWMHDSTELNRFQTEQSAADGKFWVRNSDGVRVHRFDAKTETWEDLGSFHTPDTDQLIRHYGVIADWQNNLWLLDYGAAGIGKVDARTGKLVAYKRTVSQPVTAPRRGMVDKQGLVWFGEYMGNAIGMYDPDKDAMHEWVLPSPWSDPYDVTSDKNGEAWAGSMMTDRVDRLDPKTGEVTEYPLPRSTNIRRVFVDNSTTPVTFWTGSNHGASIVRLEPLD